jgi:hypothetical protein
MTNAPVAAMGEAPKAISAQGVTTAPAATARPPWSGAPAATHDTGGKEIVVVAERIPGQVEAAQPRWP